MKLIPLALLAACAALLAQTPEFTPDGKLVRPVNYREWIYLSSGLDMTYGAPRANTDPAFDNVFVAPSAYREFQATGKWPEKTIFILEIRAAASHGSINKAGHFQTDVRAIEAEVKDSSRFAEKWAFFSFGGEKGSPASAAKAIPPGSMCIACHSKNGAVDNTFVQFYPTLLESARKHGTLKAGDPLSTPTP